MHAQVDAKGNLLEKRTKQAEAARQREPTPRSENAGDEKNDDITPAELQTSTLWKRINPGCMTGYMDLPSSHYSRNYQFDDKNKDYIEQEKDWEFHFLKTEITEYTEAAVRHKMTLEN